MQVVETKKTLVFAPHDPDTVLDFIPHAKKFEHNGTAFVAVPHKPEESIVLRNMGLRDIPAPILLYYNWPGRVKAMSHQKSTSAFLTTYRRALCLNAPGTGKTLAALWAADYLLTEGVIKKVLIVAPLSTLLPVWGKELRHHLPFRQFEILTGSRQRRIDLLTNSKAQFFIINHDGFTILTDYFNDIDLVIYDEATALKTPSSQRFRIFYKWVERRDPWLWLMTGTPIAQSPVDAWALAKLAKSEYVPRSYTAFRELVMRKVSNYRWVPRPEALEICKKVLQPSIRYSLEECRELPEVVHIYRETELSKTQAAAYKQMEENAVVWFQQNAVVAVNAAVLLAKLLQIACGVVYGDAEQIRIDAKHRLESLCELLEEIGVEQGEKVIVYCPLRGVQDWLEQELIHKKYEVASVHGSVSKSDRDDIFNTFQNTERIQILLAHPKVAAHGLTLTRAKSIIWFSPIYSLEQYEQANARIRRLTTDSRTAIYHLYATPLEKELYRRLQHKKSVLSDFLNLVKGVNSEV